MEKKGLRGRKPERLTSDTWLTPPSIIKALGTFDLDPCTPRQMPWETAKARYTVEDDGLRSPWFGRVWLNPPYGNKTGLWLSKLALHGNGIALIFARTETEMFFRYVWERADGILFLKKRIQFLLPEGGSTFNAPAPSVLIAYGAMNAQRLATCDIPGQYLPLIRKNQTVTQQQSLF